jgi:hypothetical protein
MKLKTICVTIVLSIGVFLVGCSSYSNPSSGSPALNSGAENYQLASEYENQSAEEIAKDVASLSEALNLVGTNGLNKKSVDDPGGSLTIDWNPWNYADGWWSRSGLIDASGKDGAVTITGSDSAQFKDASGASLKRPTVETFASGTLLHHGLIDIEEADGGYVNIYRDINLDAVVDKSAEPVTATFNGTLAQGIQAENAEKTSWINFNATADAEDIVYEKRDGEWSKPVSGTITMESPYKKIVIVFNDETATLTVTSQESGEVVKVDEIDL